MKDKAAKSSSANVSPVLIIGAGNMGGALAKGLSEEDKGFSVRVHDIHEGRLDDLTTRSKGSRLEAVGELSAAALPKEGGAVVFCVKPQDLNLVAAPLKGKVPKGCLVVSILAGVPIADVEEALAYSGPVVRAMPNIAATVHAAATAMCASGSAGETHKALAEKIFRAIGEADWTKESLLDAVTGLSGSGPAYVYMVIEALTDGGVKMGIPRALSARLAMQTVLGSAMLVKETGLHPAVLRDQVTTPGGTTINAIHELEDRGLRAMLISAVETATKRSAKLRKKAK